MKKYLLINTGLHIAVIDTATDQFAEQNRDSAPAGSWIETDELPTCADLAAAEQSANGVAAGMDAVPTDEVAANNAPLNLFDYMIEGGRLVPVSPEILAARAREQERMELWGEQERLKRALARTDHKTLQFAEGDITEADFAPIRATREAQRTRIREITAILAAK